MLQVNQIVKVVDNISNHRFDIGEFIRVKKINIIASDYVLSFVGCNNKDHWYLQEIEVEEV